MRHLKTALLLLAPAVAAAQLSVSSGSSFTVTPETGVFEFSFSGAGFSSDIALQFGLGAPNPLPYPISSFSNGELIIFADTIPNGENLTMDLTVNGVPWTIFDGFPVGPQRGSAEVTFTASGFPSSPGTYSLPVSFSAGYLGAPVTQPAPDGCGTPGVCQQLGFEEAGTGLFTLGPSAIDPSKLGVNKAVFTFPSGSAPEPSASSLLLLGLAGVAFLGCRRRAARGLLQCQLETGGGSEFWATRA